VPHDDLAWADLSVADDPALVAWLADASCDPHVKALVVAAVHACGRGISAEAMAGLERAVRSCGLEPGLLELARIRASQMMRLDGLDLPGGTGQVQAGPGRAAR
jgi:uncharacterized protein YbjT (DUF2867 family)